MKSNDLSKLLVQLASLVDLYKNNDLNFIINDLKRLKTADDARNAGSKTEPSKMADSDRKSRIAQIAKNIGEMKINEIEEQLSNDEIFPTMLYIKFFAEKIGLDIGTRQNKANAIHTILRSIDRMRIDSVISTRNG